MDKQKNPVPPQLTPFNSETAKEAQKKSVESRNRNNILKNAAKRMITDELAEGMMVALATKVTTTGDAAAARALWEILGERIDKTELDLGNKTLSAAVTMTSEEKQKAIKEMLKELS